MTTPQRGDRVRVEYEATYRRRESSGVHVVGFIGDENYESDAPIDAKLTVLPKPLRVGDVVRLGVDPEPPDGTVLLLSGDVYRRTYDTGSWTLATASDSTYDWADFAGDGSATVVWLPGGES